MSRSTTLINGKKYPRNKKSSRHKIPKNAPKEAHGKKWFGWTDGDHKKENAVKNVDYIKYGYGNGVKKENRTKNYKKEI